MNNQNINNEYKIILMNKDDLHLNFDSFYNLCAENIRGHVVDQIIEEDYILKKTNEIFYYFESNSVYLLGLFDENILIGFLWSYKRIFLVEKRIYINSLIIDNKYRGKGLGKLLMFELEKIAKNEGIFAIDVSTATFKKDAIRFYENLGFEPERIQLRKSLS